MLKFIIDNQNNISFVDSNENISYKIGTGIIEFSSYNFDEINNIIETFVHGIISQSDKVNKSKVFKKIKILLRKAHPYYYNVSDKYISECILIYISNVFAENNKVKIDKHKRNDYSTIINYNKFEDIVNTACIDINKDKIMYAWQLSINYLKQKSQFTASCLYKPLDSIKHFQKVLRLWLTYVLDIDFSHPLQKEVKKSIRTLNPTQRQYLYSELFPINNKLHDNNYDFIEEYDLFLWDITDTIICDPPNINYVLPKYKEGHLRNNQLETSYAYNKRNDLISEITQYSIYISQEYEISRINELIYFEALKMIEYDVKVIKCAQCNDYFIPKNGHQRKYCNKILSNGKHCGRVGALSNHYNNIRSNPISDIHRREYFKMLARRNRSKEYEDNLKIMPEGKVKKLKTYISFEDYDKWLIMAYELKKKALNDEISIEEFKELISTSQK